jgi:hypothetical protein
VVAPELHVESLESENSDDDDAPPRHLGPEELWALAMFHSSYAVSWRRFTRSHMLVTTVASEFQWVALPGTAPPRCLWCAG